MNTPKPNYKSLMQKALSEIKKKRSLQFNGDRFLIQSLQRRESPQRAVSLFSDSKYD